MHVKTTVVAALFLLFCVSSTRLEAQPCQPDFHGLPAQSFQACFDYWVKKGLRPVTLTAYELKNNELFMAGSFQKGTCPPVHHLMTSDQYQQYFDTYKKQGFRPDRISVVTRPTAVGGDLFTVIWRPIEGEFETRHVLTTDEFAAKQGQMQGAGYANTDLAVYQIGGGQLRFAATWVKKPVSDYVTAIDMSEAEFTGRDQQLAARGFAVTHLEPYPRDDGIKFAAIWEKRQDAWQRDWLMSGKAYQAKYNAWASQGYRLHQLVAAGDSEKGDDFITALWVKP